ncbi:MAG: DUF1343 domain-containing protein [Deltaproteobacteria bacterium]|nr:DUF1343 domain-containing protein [Deltaproteobacteria bacterium]
MRCSILDDARLWVVGLCVLFLSAPALAAPTAPASSWLDCQTRPLPRAKPEAVGLVPDLAGDLRTLMSDAVRRKLTPGLVLLVARRGKVVFQHAAGSAAKDAIYDLASLSKVVATTPLLLQLVERKRLSLDDVLGKYLPELRGTDKAQIQVRDLLLHISGLHSVVWAGKKPSVPQRQLEDKEVAIFERIRRSRLRAPPKVRFKYSDIGYVLLGRLVERLSGKSLPRAARDGLFKPLGMCDTGYVPRGARLRRVVNPWPRADNRGVVYDPIASRMMGVAGHAGLYGSAEDLSRFGQMVLNGGRLDGRRVLSKATLRLMQRRHHLPGKRQRMLGWHPVTGVGLSSQALGHTGYTGTFLTIDPVHQLVVVLLSDRTRFEPPRSLMPLRRQVHRLVAGSLLLARRPRIEVGLDRLVRGGFRRLKGARVALITNRTAVDRRGRWIVDLLARAPAVQLVAIFAPEHGLKAALDRHLGDGALRRRGQRIPVYSLYGRRRRPTDRTLRGVDTLVFDMQAVGVRYYTYYATMGWAMEEAARRKLRFVVLDRPNPLGGVSMDGPLSSARRRTSTAYHPIPVRHGMTIGELARLYNGERHIGARLEVVRLRRWRRSWRSPRLGWAWRNPSPNIRSWREALLYAAVGLLESTNLAVGRGTESPFNHFGAPWIDGPALADELNALKLPGVFFVPVTFTPKSSVHRGARCGGVRLLVTDVARFRPVQVAVHMALTLRLRYRALWKTKHFYRLFNHKPTTDAILAGRSAKGIIRGWQAALRRFSQRRQRYLLYR